MNGHTAGKSQLCGPHEDLVEIDGRCFVEGPAPALMLEIRCLRLSVMSPDGAIGVAGWQFQGEGLVQTGDVILKEPGFFGEIGPDALFILVGDDTSGIASRWSSDLGLDVLVVIALPGISNFCEFVVLDYVLMAVGTYAPGVEGEDLSVLIKRDDDDGIFPTLRT